MALNWDSLFIFTQHTYYTLTSPPTISKDSRIEVDAFDSHVLKEKREYRMYIPAGYDKDSTLRLPVLYLLHGYPGSDSDWLINTKIQQTADTLIKEKKLPPLLIVFPDGNGKYVHDGQYVDAKKVNQPMESYLKELVSYIDSHYRTIPKREYRAIGGLSSGGYGAVNVGLRNNKLFGYIISHSGYFQNREWAITQLIGKNTPAWRDNNPLDYVSQITIDPNTRIYMDIGRSDSKEFVAENVQFDQLLAERGIYHTFILTEGDHGWKLWRQNINSSLAWLGLEMKKTQK